MSLWLIIERYTATNRFVVQAATAIDALNVRGTASGTYVSGETDREPPEVHELVIASEAQDRGRNESK